MLSPFRKCLAQFERCGKTEIQKRCKLKSLLEPLHVYEEELLCFHTIKMTNRLATTGTIFLCLFEKKNHFSFGTTTGFDFFSEKNTCGNPLMSNECWNFTKGRLFRGKLFISL